MMHSSECTAEDEEVLLAFADGVARRILLSTDSSPKSVRELVKLLDLPQSTIYHKLHELQAQGLVSEQQTSTETGRRLVVYRSRVQDAEVYLVGGDLNVKVRYRTPAGKRGTHKGP